MKCFYHLDLDGKCAGYLVWHYACLGEEDEKPENFIKINYGMEFPLDKIKKDERVFIVDFSIEPGDMRELLKITKNVVWIDHHKTTIEKYKDFESYIPGIRMTGPGISGASLVWWYFNNNAFYDGMEKVQGLQPQEDEDWDEDMPLALLLVADWDTWTFNYREKTKYFHTAFEMLEYEPWQFGRWFELIKDPYVLIEQGRLLYQYKQKQAEEYIKSKGFAVEFEGYKCFAVNYGLINSDFFESVDDKYDVYIGFAYNGGSKRWSYSLRAANDDVDVSKIAVKYGGGGHKGAAGFASDKYVLGEMSQ